MNRFSLGDATTAVLFQRAQTAAMITFGGADVMQPLNVTTAVLHAAITVQARNAAIAGSGGGRPVTGAGMHASDKAEEGLCVTRTARATPLDLQNPYLMRGGTMLVPNLPLVGHVSRLLAWQI
eukprot:scaffold6692_cov19-Tisochrysis_lutea.AAC.1